MFVEGEEFYFLPAPRHRHVLEDWQIKADKLNWLNDYAESTLPKETVRAEEPSDSAVQLKYPLE